MVSSISTPDSHHRTQSSPLDEIAFPSRKARRDNRFMSAIISLTGRDTSIAHSNRTWKAESKDVYDAVSTVNF